MGPFFWPDNIICSPISLFSSVGINAFFEIQLARKFLSGEKENDNDLFASEVSAARLGCQIVLEKMLFVENIQASALAGKNRLLSHSWKTDGKGSSQ